jgi:hypothetical protein
MPSPYHFAVFLIQSGTSFSEYEMVRMPAARIKVKRKAIKKIFNVFLFQWL